MQPHFPFLPVVLGTFLIASPLAAQVQFEEQDGYVVMEMESVPIAPGLAWTQQQALQDFKGKGYYRFVGNGICSGPATDPLRYTFRIKTPGTYELRLRASRIYHCVTGTPTGRDNHCKEDGGAQRGCTSFGEPNAGTCADSSHCIRTDLSNDVFVSVEDAGGSHVKWVGQRDTKVTKLFGGGNNAWSWTGKRALDPGGAKQDAQWKLGAGDYTLVVQGRSKDFRVDRMVFFDADKNSIKDAEDLPETLFVPSAMPDMSQNGPPDMAKVTPDMGFSPIPDMAVVPVSDMTTPSLPDAGGDPDLAQSTSGDMGGMQVERDFGTGDRVGDGMPASEDSGCATGQASGPANLCWVLLGLGLGWVRRRRS